MSETYIEQFSGMNSKGVSTRSVKVETKVAKKSTGKRRFHKKSRKGCATCKRRRVKCDERQPRCGNCERMRLDCVYLNAEQKSPESDTSKTSIKLESEVCAQISPPDVQSHHQYNNPVHDLQHQQNQQQQHLPPQMSRQNSLLGTFPNLQHDIMKMMPPMTPSMPSAPLPQPMSPISQFLQQLPQSPIGTSAAQIGAQFLNNFPPEVQVKLFQQFQQLPPDKQQELYQSLPMSAKPSSDIMAMPDDIMGNLGKSSDPISDLISNFLPDKSSFLKNQMSSEKTPTPQELASHHQRLSNSSKDIPIPQKDHLNANGGPSLSPDTIRTPLPPITNPQNPAAGQLSDLNMLDLRLMYHYTTKVWPTITAAGISDSKIWSDDIPMLAFKYPFLMHSVLAFSATHLSRNERGLDECVTCHRAEALRLLRDAVLEMSPENTDALVAAALILIMDSLANASLPTSSSIKSLPPSAWIFHVKGAATILTAVWPLSETSRFYKFISVDLGDLGEIGYDLISGELANNTDSNENSRSNSITRTDGDNDVGSNRRSKYKSFSPASPDLTTLANMAARTSANSSKPRFSSIDCFDDTISDMFPVPLNSPYFPTLAYMAKLHKERDKSDFILRIFAFPALLDKRFLGLLINCDLSAMRIMRCYYKLLRNFTEEMKEKVWFLEGVSSVLPADVDQYAGGGGMHMMLDFLGGPSTIDDDGNGENYVDKSAAQSGLLDTNNLPSASMSDSLGLNDGALADDEN